MNAPPDWVTLILDVLKVVGLGSVIAAIFKTIPALKKIGADREANLLNERAEEMESMRNRLSCLESTLALALEELRLVRHDLANANHGLDMFIALIEANPERAAHHAAKVKEARETARAVLADERADLTRARVANIRSGK